MKIRTKNTLIRSFCVALVASLAGGMAMSASAQSLTLNIVAGAYSSGLKDVTGEVDTAALRLQYANQNVTQVDTAAEEDRWFIVEFAGDSLMNAFERNSFTRDFSAYTNTSEAIRIREGLEREHNSFLQRLKASGIEFEYKYSYTTLTNGVAVQVRNQDAQKLENMTGVKSVYATESYAAPKVAVSNNANVYTTGIYDTSNVGYKGKGMVVAILDTGLDYTHDAFQEMPDSDTIGLKEDTIGEVLENLEAHKRSSNLTASDFYLNDKVPFAYDYADNDGDVYPSYSVHGTHVAGIVAGKDDGKEVNKETHETFVGVAPDAQLVICKVFSDDLGSKRLGNANSADILAAISDCVTLGVDVINMSLGTTAGFSDEGFTEAGGFRLSEVYQKVEDAGISLIVAASNDYSSGFGGDNGTNLTSNPDSGTVGSPSTYPSALSVASINGQPANYFIANKKQGVSEDEQDVAFLTESSNANGKVYKFLDLLYEKTDTEKSEELTLNYVIVPGVGRASDYTNTVKRAFNGGRTIALIKRGDITFAEKVRNAMANGAVACIIYNHLSGTIRMTLGEVNDPIPTCSISMDAGAMLVKGAPNGRIGTVSFSYDYAAGPFMSDFSSWGPTPDLKLKPEITAHGGEITSSVPGGYEVQSGTSMATPNMSGAVALLRQHVKASRPEITDPVELNNYVYSLLMSTATMARNETNNPYSPRKQGAGLAGIADAVHTQGYLTVEGSDKPKLELGDDPNKTGVYNMEFTVHNISGDPVSYTPNVYVMTESLSTDLKTVAEKAYMLENCNIEVTAGGMTVPKGESFTVPKGESVKIHVTVTLDSGATEYLDRTFQNGMYVEGFVRLESSETGIVELGIPYLAFYGDWTKAPLFDYSAYEVEESAADKSIEEEDKLKASAAASRPLGLYNDGDFYVMLGSYIYEMANNYTEILPSKEHAALSIYDEENRRTIYELYTLYAGLLRGAKGMQVDIVDVATGESIYSKLETNVRKSYAAGGSNVGSMVGLYIDPLSWNLSNNKTYEVRVKGVLDYDLEEGRVATTERDEFSFTFTVDTEAPIISDYRIRYEPYEENKVTKYRIYLDVDVFDNHYAMAMLPCHMKDKDDGSLNEDGTRAQELTLLTEFPVPIYSQKGGTTTVSYEITDCYDEYVKTGGLYMAVQDYALNESVFQIDLSSSIVTGDSFRLKTDDKLTHYTTSPEGVEEYNLSLSQYESYKVLMEGLPTGTEPVAFTYYTSNTNGRIYVKDNEIFANSGSGSPDVTVTDPSGKLIAIIHIKLSAGNLSKPRIESVSFDPVIDGDYYLNAFGSGEIDLKPNTERLFVPRVNPWYCEYLYDIEYEWTTSNQDKVEVDDDGTVRTIASGSAYITAKIKNSSVSKSVKVNVDDELHIINNNTLYKYYGGKDAVIPDSKNILTIHEDAFKYNTLIETLVLPISLTSIPEDCFEGCVNLREVTIPAECTVINKNAFKGCVSLEKIILGEAEDKITGDPMAGRLTIAPHAFDGCVKLKTIENQQRLTTVSDYAFANCTSLQSIDISGLRVGGDGIFMNCTSLSEVTTSSLTYIGKNMFAGCTSLESFELNARSVPDSAFRGCTSLASITFNENLNEIGAYAFYGTALSSVTLPEGRYAVGERAFASCANLQSVTIPSGTNVSFGPMVFAGDSKFKAFSANGNSNYTVTNGVLYNADGTELLYVPAGIESVTLPSTVTKIGAGALAGSSVKTLDMTNVTEIGAYAFAESGLERIDLSGLKNIPEGAFYKCGSLAATLASPCVTGLDNIESVGAYAFAECVALQQKFDFGDKLLEVGAHAFEKTPILHFAGENVESVGDYAFYSTNILAGTTSGGNVFDPISLLQLKSLGSFAFAKIQRLNTIHLGPLEVMGEYALSECANLRTVTFAEGAKVIGQWAFAIKSKAELNALTAEIDSGHTNAPKNLTSVTVPATVENIGAYAFFDAYNLSFENVNLSGVKEAGTGAFLGCSKLTGANLENVVTVCDMAFAYTGLTSLNLASAKEIGARAFENTPLASLAIPAAERIGMLAFSSTALTSVTIPASLKGLTYEDEWYRVNDFEEAEHLTGRLMYRFGLGAFASNPLLTTFVIAEGNDTFFVDPDNAGVLYGKTEKDGYVLLQYAGGVNLTDYNVLDGTVRIGDGAFIGVSRLNAVVFPSTLKEVGSAAFLTASVKDYTFATVEAPVLEAMYDVTVVSEEVLSGLGGRFGIYYSNFSNYVIMPMFGMNTETGEAYDFHLTLRRPENGTGYTGWIWDSFFSTVVETDYAAEEGTNRAKDLINALPSTEEIASALNGMTNAEKLSYLKGELGEQVKAARAAYNGVLSAGQLALITNEYAKLTAVEKQIRDMRNELGDPVALVRLEIATQPTKYEYYLGETFDPAGMVVKAVYDDTSEVVLASGDYTLSINRPLELTDSVVEISYEGKTAQVRIAVTEKPADADGDGGDNNGADLGLIVGISVAVIVLAGLAAGVTVFVVRKKRSAEPEEQETASKEAESEQTEEPEQTQTSAEETNQASNDEND